MKNLVYINNLYDYYGELLTEKQKRYFEDYNFHNLSLGEMSENYNVSRSAVHKQIKDIENKLLLYEEKIKLNFKVNQIKEIIKNIDEDTKRKIEEIL